MSKFVNSIEDFFAFCSENEVAFVDFRFSDFKGTWRSITYNYKKVDEEILTNGIMCDGSSIAGFQPIEKSDMKLIPDIKTAFLDPFTADVTIVVICDIFDIYKNQPYEKCPRNIAKKAQKFLQDSGIGDVCYFGPENEFFIFDDVKIIDDINCAMYKIDSEEGIWNSAKDYKDGFNSAHHPGTKGGYLALQPIDSTKDIRAEICNVLEQIGLDTFVLHHEVAQAQCELGVKFNTLVEAADNVQIYKYVVKMVAHLNGKTATFMPKPLYSDNGSGMHVHQSIYKDGKNLFYKDKEYGNLSDEAKYYIGGILHHANAIAAFTNPSTNSYKRLIPGFEAPSILTYSSNNRSASIRIPYGGTENSTRVEVRFPDGSANPYLAFSAMLLAGLDGIKNKIEPVGPMDENLFKLSLDEIREKGIKQLPHTLRESLECLIGNHKFLSEIMSEEFINAYQHFEFSTQVWPYEARPTPFEFLTNYSC